MPILRKFKRKEKGVEETVHLGALAQNITQDATHRFVTDAEKQAWNAKPGADTQNLKTYTALSQLELSAPVTMEQIYSQMPSSSFFIMGVEGTGDISNLPENDTYGIIEIFKRDRNFARFTPSLSSAMAGSMFYGTFSWSGGAAFTGWKRIIDDKRLANNLTTTAEGYGLDARQGKKLQDQISQVSSDLGGLSFGKTTEGEWGYKPEGADSVIPFKSAVLSGANIYNQLWASGGNGSHLNATRYTFAEDYSSVFVVQSSSGIMGYGSESGIAYSGDGTVISLFSKRQSIGSDSSQSYYVDYIENPKTGDTLTFGQATGAQNRAVSIFAFD